MVPYRSSLFMPGHKPAWIDKAHADTATEWLAHAWATPGGQTDDDRPAPADRLGFDAPEGGH